MANAVESACVYNSRDQPSAPVLLLLCSSSPPPSVCTCCSLPMKGALKAVHLREAVRADVVLWKHEKQVCKSELWQNYPKVLPPSLSSPSLFPWSPHVAQAALEFFVSYTGHKLVIFLSHPPK